MNYSSKKAMQIDIKEISKNLPKKGFVVEETHHKYFYHEYNGKRTGIYTYISHGSKIKAIGDNLINMMKKQLQLDNKQQVLDLFKCPMTTDDYNDILMDKNLLQEE